MLIKLPKKLKHLIALRGTEMLLANNEMDTPLETPRAIRGILSIIVKARATKYSIMVEEVCKALTMVNSMRDINLKGDTPILTLTQYLETDIETDTVEDMMRLFKDEEFGVWLLEHLVGSRTL